MYDPSIHSVCEPDHEDYMHDAVGILEHRLRPERVSDIDTLDQRAFDKIMEEIHKKNEDVLNAVCTINSNGEYLLNMEKFNATFKLLVDSLRARWFNSHSIDLKAIYNSREGRRERL